MAAADQVKQHAGLGLVLADICDVVADEQAIVLSIPSSEGGCRAIFGSNWQGAKVDAPRAYWLAFDLAFRLESGV
jgi:hypothetical protein